MLTLDYAYYSETFKGQLSEEQFQANLPKAVDMVEMMISSEPEDEEQTEAVKRALCYGVDYEQTQTAESALVSEHLDDYTYTKDMSALTRQAASKMSRIIAILGRAGMYNPTVKLRKSECYHC